MRMRRHTATDTGTCQQLPAYDHETRRGGRVRLGRVFRKKLENGALSRWSVKEGKLGCKLYHP